MKTKKNATAAHPSRHLLITALLGFLVFSRFAHASDWVSIGNPGNDAQSASNRTHGGTGAIQGDGRGAVAYAYEISKYAVSIAEWQTFYNATDIGKQGSFHSSYNYWNDGVRNVGTNAPVSYVSFHQAAQYVNWLTSGNASVGAYTIDATGSVTGIDRTYRNASGTLYAIPSEDEWYKAAYFNTAGEHYTLYSNGANTAPPKSADGITGWNYDNAISPNLVWTVDKGTEEQNGTFNMIGNIWEWTEGLNSSNRVYRGGRYNSPATHFASSDRYSGASTTESNTIGFRIVAIIPEPGTLFMMGLTGLAAVLGLRRRKS